MKRMMIFLLVAAMLLSSLAFAENSAMPVTDDRIGDLLKEWGIIRGDESGNLNGDMLLTREQAIVILNRMMKGADEADKMAAVSPYDDVAADHWAAKQIAYAKEKGWTNGIGDNLFGLGRSVTTQEFLTLILRTLGHEGDDVYATAMKMAEEYQLLAGTFTNRAKDKIRRDDVFIIMYHALYTKPLGSDVILAEKIGLFRGDSSLRQTHYPLTLRDGEGSIVKIESEPQRIVSVAPSVTEILFAIGAGDKVIGRTDYCDYPAEVADIASIGTLTEPNIEKIAELNPDLVIASTHFTEEAAKQLENLGIQVYVLKDQENFSGLYRTMMQASQIVNLQDNAFNLISELKLRVLKVRQRVAGLEPVTCYYSVATGDTEFAATGDTFIGELLTMAGGDNIAKDGENWAYSAEKLLEHNPEIILVGDQFDALKTFVSLEAHKDLDAVKNGRVIEIDSARIGRLSPRIVESLEEVAQILHPETAQDAAQTTVFLVPWLTAK